jgi:hypothetical protein
MRQADAAHCAKRNGGCGDSAHEHTRNECPPNEERHAIGRARSCSFLVPCPVLSHCLVPPRRRAGGAAIAPWSTAVRVASSLCPFPASLTVAAESLSASSSSAAALLCAALGCLGLCLCLCLCRRGRGCPCQCAPASADRQARHATPSDKGKETYTVLCFPPRVCGPAPRVALPATENCLRQSKHGRHSRESAGRNTTGGDFFRFKVDYRARKIGLKQQYSNAHTSISWCIRSSRRRRKGGQGLCGLSERPSQQRTHDTHDRVG